MYVRMILQNACRAFRGHRSLNHIVHCLRFRFARGDQNDPLRLHDAVYALSLIHI